MPTLTETVEMYRAGDLSGADLVMVLHRDKIPSDVVALIAELHELAMLKRGQTQELPLLEDPPDQTQPAWKGVDQPFDWKPASKFHTRKGLDAMPAVEEQLVYDLGERIGYGRLMQLAEKLWARSAKSAGRLGANHTCGPCAALLVPCTHQGDEPHKCDWCAGTGRVTKHVAGVMEREAMTKVSLEEGRTIVTPINEVLEDLAVRRSKG